MADIRVGIVGYGKIARDQHVPAIAGNSHFRLTAVVAPGGAPDSPVTVFPDHKAMLAAGTIDAVAICTPAAPRYAIARDCLGAGLDVLLEKPPTTTLGEIDELAMLAENRGRVLFTAWHAQHAAAVPRLRTILAEEGLRSLQIVWLEDVTKWHPGQQWIWAPGGFGVFDAGINALSIASHVAPTRLMIAKASFALQTEGQQPIAATLDFQASGAVGPMTARFDWRHTGEERWDIGGVTAKGTKFLLSDGGAALAVGKALAVRPSGGSEYAGIYADFADTIATRRSFVDREPLRLLADANLIAERSPAN